MVGWGRAKHNPLSIDKKLGAKVTVILLYDI